MKTPTKTNNLFDGIQKLYFFANGQGASVVQHSHSYGGREGKWELAVLQGNLEEHFIDYSTEVTEDVLGYLDEEEVEIWLTLIEELPLVQ